MTTATHCRTLGGVLACTQLLCAFTVFSQRRLLRSQQGDSSLGDIARQSPEAPDCGAHVREGSSGRVAPACWAEAGGMARGPCPGSPLCREPFSRSPGRYCHCAMCFIPVRTAGGRAGPPLGRGTTCLRSHREGREGAMELSVARFLLTVVRSRRSASPSALHKCLVCSQFSGRSLRHEAQRHPKSKKAWVLVACSQTPEKLCSQLTTCGQNPEKLRRTEAFVPLFPASGSPGQCNGRMCCFHSPGTFSCPEGGEAAARAPSV